jgi:hypothetical protein
MTSTDKTSTEARKAYAEKLRAFAEFIEAHDDLPLPSAPEAQATLGGTLQDQRDIIDFASAELATPVHRWVIDDVEHMSVRYRDEAGFALTIYACASYATDYPDGPEVPAIDSDAWDDHADPVPLPHPVFNGSDAALPQVGGESVEDAAPYLGMSDRVVEAIGDLLLHDAQMRGYEDPAVSA